MMGQCYFPFQTDCISPSSCLLAAMIRIQRVTSIVPTFHDLPKLIILPRSMSWIPTLIQMTCWRCAHLLHDPDRHHLLAMVRQLLSLPPIPLLRIQTQPLTTMITEQSPTLHPLSSRPTMFTLAPSILPPRSQVLILSTYHQSGPLSTAPT